MKVKKRSKRGFTLVELIVTLAVSSILLVTLSTFLVFTYRVNTDYRNRANTLHSANSMKRAIDTYIDEFNEGGLTVTALQEVPTTRTKFISYVSTTRDNSFNIYYEAYKKVNEKETFPKLTILYDPPETIDDDTALDVIYAAKSNIGLTIK